LKKKIEQGPGFGEFKTDYESIFERMGRATWRGGGGGVGGKIKSAVVDHGNPGVMHGNKADTALACKTDDEVLEGLLNVIPSHQFTFGRFMALSSTLGWITPKATPDSLVQAQPSSPTTTTTTTQDPPIEPTTTPPPDNLGPVLSNLNTQLKSLQESLPSRTALIIFTGHSDPRRMAALNVRKSAFDTGYRGGKTSEELTKEGITWSMSDVREMEQEVELARRGLLFLGIKQ
jgi:RNA exonuclease 1